MKRIDLIEAAANVQLLTLVLDDLKDPKIFDGRQDAGRLIVETAEKIRAFGFSLAEEPKDAQTVNAAKACDVVTFY